MAELESLTIEPADVIGPSEKADGSEPVNRDGDFTVNRKLMTQNQSRKIKFNTCVG